MPLEAYNAIIIRLLLAHLIGDFVFQSKSMVKARNDSNIINRIKGNGIHVIIHLLILWVIMLPFPFSKTIIPMIICICIHFALDFIKSTLISNNITSSGNIYMFLADQLLHSFVIFVVGYFITAEINGNIRALLKLKLLFRDAYIYVKNIFSNQNLITLIFLLVLATWGVGVFINIFLEYIQRKNKHIIMTPDKIILLSNSEKDTTDTGIANGGFIIGLLERLMIIFSMVIGKSQLIGFILAVKAVARLKKFDDDRFVEMFIIGSFISFIASIIIGEIIVKMGILRPLI